jgi:hypothetical protein
MLSLVPATRKIDQECHIQHLSHAHAVYWVHLEEMSPRGKLCLNSDMFGSIRAIQLPSGRGERIGVRRLSIALACERITNVLCACFAFPVSIHMVYRLNQ